VNWDSLERNFGELEAQIIQSKMTLVANECEREELRGTIKVLQMTVDELVRVCVCCVFVCFLMNCGFSALMVSFVDETSRG
jgi:hypothetical protein